MLFVYWVVPQPEQVSPPEKSCPAGGRVSVLVCPQPPQVALWVPEVSQPGAVVTSQLP